VLVCSLVTTLVRIAGDVDDELKQVGGGIHGRSTAAGRTWRIGEPQVGTVSAPPRSKDHYGTTYGQMIGCVAAGSRLKHSVCRLPKIGPTEATHTSTGRKQPAVGGREGSAAVGLPPRPAASRGRRISAQHPFTPEAGAAGTHATQHACGNTRVTAVPKT